MDKKFRINIYAGAGAGKSTTAAFLFSSLKRAGLSVELVHEFVKSWAYQKKEVLPFDQIYLFGKQLNYEYRFLSSSVSGIITDSPVFLTYVYAKKFFSEFGIHEPLLKLADSYEKEYKNINIFIDRGNKPFNSSGRWGDINDAKKIDNFLIQELEETGRDYRVFKYDDSDSIESFVFDNIVKKV